MENVWRSQALNDSTGSLGFNLCHGEKKRGGRKQLKLDGHASL